MGDFDNIVAMALDPNIIHETHQPLHKNTLPGRPSRSTLHRWIVEGLRSSVTGQIVKLNFCYRGRTRITSTEEYFRFHERLNGRGGEAGAA